MATLKNAGGGAIVRRMADTIVENRGYLSEIDGKIGDGDHGNNMAKGFGRARDRIADTDTLSGAMHTLADVLMGEIGGSMGPLYGMMFDDMASAVETLERIDRAAFGRMLKAGQEGVMAIGEAKRGDKSLLDALIPAVEAFEADPGELSSALAAMKAAAERGRDETRDMVSRIGRSSRLGERSRGVLDAGATSCCMILSVLADETRARLA
ncbi:dihydroxyacetone kinase subunit DhaL [Roseivivax isoporae]|uniref:Dihydroxyacetone kinase n=1 Tax=Roseivivax isoporae LMG 25204 TaxID=1449351 RepID=X7F150_9RHOB|nr:dihydroxyacetone kinase subunit DhaL [Roseivivax isoporae]ETX26490.1 dihydroxyacetone kinase [Roseivivax isoporae LMG 25204]